MSTPLLLLAAAFVLILANGFFVAAEFGLLTVERPAAERAAAEGDRRARSVVAALRKLSFQLSGTQLGITIPVFMRQLNDAITVNTFMVGLIKAPVFAFIIALVGCFEGLQVERNAASVGKLTTRSVVESIFIVIVLDAGFSILFSIVGL